MAQNKRRRGGTESEEDESDIEVERSRSDRHDRGKRTRLSPETPTQDHQDYENSEPDLTGVYTYQPSGYDASTALDMFSSEDDEEGELDETRASDYIKKKMQEATENKASESGIIEEVSMKNFMCHSRLTIPLGPLINFIIGHNGSGKSAILTAIMICLGTKAGATNRAGSLKSLIKEGQESAWVAVKLKNQGEGAYQHDMYGNSIVVERHFNASGTSSFKIKNSEGRQISTKKTDLEDISDFFALQIDNPMNVLSQDMARQFLSNSTPSDKYRFFIKGTQLHQLDNDYSLVEDSVNTSEERNETRQEDVAVLGERKKKAEEKKRMVDQASTIQTQINSAVWMHAWAQIEEQERNLARFDADIEKHDGSIQRAQRAAENASQIYEEEDGNHHASLGVIQDLQEELAPAQEIHVEAKERFDEKARQVSDAQATQRQIRTDRDRHRHAITNWEGQIAAERARIANAEGPAHAQKVTELEEKRAALPALQERLTLHRDTKPQLQAASSKAAEEANAAQAPIARKNDELRQAEGLLSRLVQDKGNQNNAYSHQIHGVIRAIKSETRFRDQVVGPMGFHVHLKKPEWAGIIETTCGGNLDAFVVTNKHDQGILSDIMRRQNCNSSILIGRGARIDTSRNEPEQGVDTILRVTEIDNDLVRNQLIINQRIDQTVLIKNQAEGNQYAQRKNLNVVAVLTMHTHNTAGGWRYTTTRGGGNQMGPVAPWKRAIRMKTSAEDQIRIQREAVGQIKREIDHLANQRRDKELLVKAANEAIVRHDREAIKLRTDVQRLQARIEELNDEIAINNINDGGKLEELNSQLEEARQELETALASYSDSVVDKDRIDKASKEVKKEVDAAHAVVLKLEKNIKQAQERSDRQEKMRQDALRNKNQAVGLLEEAEREKAEVVEERERLARQLAEDLIPQAEQVHPRIPVEEGMTVAMIDKRLDALMKERETMDRRIGGNREQIYERHATASENFKQAHDDLDRIIRHTKLVKDSLIYRKGRWSRFRKFITTRAQILFMYLLSERGFRGRIIADHSEKLLDIAVEPDMTKASDKGRQTKTLSGGEKSFSTICLLLSIWEAMGSPIRCLDEFDVFMDHANREISMKMMVQAARRSVGRQFILITPQAMTAVEGWHDVKIFKMTDPERGQQNLPYGE